MIIRKSPEEIERIAASGRLVRSCLELLAETVRPGMTTKELDTIAEDFIRSHDAIPTFQGYHGFPGSICASPNDMVVHGIPGPTRLNEGDILGLDVGVTLDGWVADAALTVAIGEITPAARGLMEATKASLERAILQCVAGNRVGDISHAGQSYVEPRGYAVVRSLVGHGVGRDLHEDPQIPNFGPAGRGPRLTEGMVIAIEPMITIGGHEVEVGSDQWAIYTKDGSLSAHYEHTVAITKDGPRVLTVV